MSRQSVQSPTGGQMFRFIMVSVYIWVEKISLLLNANFDGPDWP